LLFWNIKLLFRRICIFVLESIFKGFFHLSLVRTSDSFISLVLFNIKFLSLLLFLLLLDITDIIFCFFLLFNNFLLNLWFLFFLYNWNLLFFLFNFLFLFFDNFLRLILSLLFFLFNYYRLHIFLLLNFLLLNFLWLLYLLNFYLFDWLHDRFDLLRLLLFLRRFLDFLLFLLYDRLWFLRLFGSLFDWLYRFLLDNLFGLL